MCDRGSGIVLIGLRRSGKSTVGALVAWSLGRPFVDLDELIASRERRSVARILVEDGEPSFRRVESRALEAAVANPGSVLATGGGTPLSPGNRRLLARHGVVIYLRVREQELLRRLEIDSRRADRPLLVGKNEREEVGTLAAQRDPVFRELADAVVDGEGDLWEVCARVLEVVRPV